MLAVSGILLIMAYSTASNFDPGTDLGHSTIGLDETGGSAGKGSGPFRSYTDARDDWVERRSAAS